MAGLYFEEFEVGQEFHHEFSRTVTEMDNTMFSLLTMKSQPLHLDAHFAGEYRIRPAAVQQPLYARHHDRHECLRHHAGYHDREFLALPTSSFRSRFFMAIR